MAKGSFEANFIFNENRTAGVEKLNLIDQLKVLMVFVRNDVDHVLEEVLRPKFSSKILLDEVFVGPVQVQLLCGDHDPAVAGGPQLVAAEKSNLEEEKPF